MSGHITEERLNDYADGSLSPAERPGVEAHLAACDACRAEVEAARRLLGRLHGMQRSIEPPTELRGTVLGSVRAPAPMGARRALWRLRYPLAAAAVVLVVATSLVTRRLVRQPASPPPVALTPAAPGPQVTTSPAQATSPAPDTPAGAAPRALPAAFRRDEARYVDEIRELQRELDAERDRLSPATIAILERNLHVIDRAIAESRAALARDPRATELGRMILSSYEQKVELLRSATSVSS